MNIDEYRAMKAQEEVQTTEPQEPTQAVVEPIEVQPTTTTESPITQNTEPIDSQTEPINEAPIEIEGIGQVDLEELKRGYLRQQDYTKKTTEVARERERLQQIQQPQFQPQPQYQTYNPVVNDFMTQQQMQVQQMVQPLQEQMYDMMLQNEVRELQAKYPDFEVMEVMNTAHEVGVANLETAYQICKGRKPVQQQDAESLKQSLRAEILAELQQQNNATASIISTNHSVSITEQPTPELSESERKIARAFGMSDEEYIKNRV